MRGIRFVEAPPQDAIDIGENLGAWSRIQCQVSALLPAPPMASMIISGSGANAQASSCPNSTWRPKNCIPRKYGWA